MEKASFPALQIGSLYYYLHGSLLLHRNRFGRNKFARRRYRQRRQDTGEDLREHTRGLGTRTGGRRHGPIGRQAAREVRARRSRRDRRRRARQYRYGQGRD